MQRADAKNPKWHVGPAYADKDVRIRYLYYTYPTDQGLVSAGYLSVLFSIDRPARAVWPYFKDFNLWQNPYGYYYTGVVGDLEGATFALTVGKDTPPGPHGYRVVRAIPEHMISIHQPVPADGSTGGMSPGFHSMLLTEHEGTTSVIYEGDHATRTQGKSEEEALKPWREFSDKVVLMWRDSFIPTLRKLVYDSKSA
jgi:hypothetical protein